MKVKSLKQNTEYFGGLNGTKKADCIYEMGG